MAPLSLSLHPDCSPASSFRLCSGPESAHRPHTGVPTLTCPAYRFLPEFSHSYKALLVPGGLCLSS